jgi:hypothetical protein
MKFGTAVLLVALTAAACTPASDKASASELEQSPPNAIQVRQASPDDPTSKTASQSTTNKHLSATRGFVEYASQRIAGTALTCTVGASTDEDGMNQRPAVKLVGRSDQTSWTTTLQVPSDYYQGRATHCASLGKSLLVLLQLDTQPAQSLSQTQLQVAKLALKDGAILQTAAIDVPGVTNPYSAWVPDVSSDFLIEAGKLVVSGRFFILDDETHHQRSFKATLDPNALN